MIKGQTALVTGAAKRLGRATALALAQQGVHIILHYKSAREAAFDLADQIQSFGVKAWTIQADFAIREQAETLIEKSIEMAGPIDVLINSASIFPKNKVLAFRGDELDLNVQVNAFSPLVLSRAFAAQNREGVIINFLDSRITSYDDEHAAYHLSKRMLFTLTRILALELAPRIRVNGVAPGLVLPPEGEDKSYLEKRKHTNPLGCYGGQEDVVEAVRFLVASPFVTGQVIFVDGGRHLKNALY